MIIFLLTLIMLSLVTALFIISFFHLSRHWIIIDPDGKRKIGGDIFKWWSVFWEQQRGMVKFYYSNDGFRHKMDIMWKSLPRQAAKMRSWDYFDINKSSFGVSEVYTSTEIQEMEVVLQCKVDYNGDGHYYLYIEEPKYVFPVWIRKPMSQCYVCMSSVFGSAAWWSVYYLQKDLFAWSTHPSKSFFLFWVVFIVVLSGINRFIGAKSYQYV